MGLATWHGPFPRALVAAGVGAPRYVAANETVELPDLACVGLVAEAPGWWTIVIAPYPSVGLFPSTHLYPQHA